jgi:beta-glucosidase
MQSLLFSTQHLLRCAAAAFFIAALSASAQGVPQPKPDNRPWMNRSLSPDKRADLVIKEMTLDEKMNFVHGTGWNGLRPDAEIPKGSLGGAGYVQGVPRLGIPGINQADSAVGIRLAAAGSHYATLLPSVLAAACSWDKDGLFLYGSVIGRELRDLGYNMSIGGGGDLARDPRNGRNFEYAGEDPVLAGTMVGKLASGVQANQVMGDIKHYAFNDQETGRTIVNVIVDKRAARESDLLAFQIAIGMAHPAGVMCSYNKVTVKGAPNANDDWSCENDYLLNDVLKKDFDFKGFVLSDWGGTHSTVKAALAGLDQEQPGSQFFGDPLKAAVQNNQVPMSRLDDAVHRVLRSMFANGVIDDPPVTQVVDPFRGRDDAEHIADESIVLLRNADHTLPLSAASVQSIAVIGSHADVGVLSGGGSAQVDSPGGNAAPAHPHPGGSYWMETVYFPSSPLKEIRRQAPNAKVQFDPGTDPAASAKLAAASQLAIVFVNQPMSEGRDSATISLPDHQDVLVDAVAAANPHTIVVIENGGPVSMPWADRVQGIVEAWYPGIGGAQSIAGILFGDVNPSARLAISFAKSDDQLPHPQVPGMDLVAHPGSGRHRPGEIPPFDYDATEGVRVGYKWFESEHKDPLFPFGFGLSYTTYAYSALKASQHEVSFTVQNTGSRAGTEVAQVYAVLPASTGESTFKRLVAWDRVPLAPGESKTVTLPLDPLYLSIFDTDKNAFTLAPGDYTILAGSSSADTPLTATVHIAQ